MDQTINTTGENPNNKQRDVMCDDVIHHSTDGPPDPRDMYWVTIENSGRNCLVAMKTPHTETFSMGHYDSLLLDLLMGTQR
jgi:hypothetical protein